ncbi:MAG TPA: hypothetical protein VII06_25540 [Chloroflexota bacterium]
MRGQRRWAGRLALVLGLAALSLAAPRAAAAQTYCANTGANNSGFSSFQPTGFSAYSGFASFPGANASGVLPAGYSTNPYGGCASTTPAASGVNPYDATTAAASQPSYSGTYASNVYNPYSGWGLTNAASYPFITYGNTAAYTPSYLQGSNNVYNGFAGFPGMAPSGALTTTNAGYALPAPASANTTTVGNAAGGNTAGGGGAAGSGSAGGASPFASYNTGAAPSSAPTSGSYVNSGGVPIYYGGANATTGTAPATTSPAGGPSTASLNNAAGVPIYYGGANGTATTVSASSGFSGYATTSSNNSYAPTGSTISGYSGYTPTGGATTGSSGYVPTSGPSAGASGYLPAGATTTGYGSTGYYTYGNGSSSGSYSGVSTMVTFCGSGSRC